MRNSMRENGSNEKKAPTERRKGNRMKNRMSHEAKGREKDGRTGIKTEEKHRAERESVRESEGVSWKKARLQGEWGLESCIIYSKGQSDAREDWFSQKLLTWCSSRIELLSLWWSRTIISVLPIRRHSVTSARRPCYLPRGWANHSLIKSKVELKEPIHGISLLFTSLWFSYITFRGLCTKNSQHTFIQGRFQ